MLRFTVLFLLLLVGLFVLCLLPVAERHFVEPFTAGLAGICTALVSMFDSNVLTYGKVIQSTSNGFAISIERGCNGIEAMIVLTAAVLAFPAPWKHRLAGLAIGFVAIQGLNLVRIISLFYLGQWSMTAFEWFRGIGGAIIRLADRLAGLAEIPATPAPAGWPPERTGRSVHRHAAGVRPATAGPAAMAYRCRAC